MECRPPSARRAASRATGSSRRAGRSTCRLRRARGRCPAATPRSRARTHVWCSLMKHISKGRRISANSSNLALGTPISRSPCARRSSPRKRSIAHPAATYHGAETPAKSPTTCSGRHASHFETSSSRLVTIGSAAARARRTAGSARGGGRPRAPASRACSPPRGTPRSPRCSRPACLRSACTCRGSRP